MAGCHAQQIQAERICGEVRPFAAAHNGGKKKGTGKTCSRIVMCRRDECPLLGNAE